MTSAPKPLSNWPDWAPVRVVEKSTTLIPSSTVIGQSPLVALPPAAGVVTGTNATADDPDVALLKYLTIASWESVVAISGTDTDGSAVKSGAQPPGGNRAGQAWSSELNVHPVPVSAWVTGCQPSWACSRFPAKFTTCPVIPVA